MVKVTAFQFCIARLFVSVSWSHANPKQVALLKWHPANTVATFPVGKEPACVAFDGENVWVNNFVSGTVTKLRARDGKNLGEFHTGAGAEAIAFDGTNMWITNSDAASVTKLRALDGALLGT